MPLGCLSICFYWIVSCLNSTVRGILSSPQRPGLHSHLQSRATENTLIRTTGPFGAQGRMHVQLKKAGQGHESREWDGLVPCSPRSSPVLSRKGQWTGHLPPPWMTAVLLFFKHISILDTFISKNCRAVTDCPRQAAGRVWNASEEDRLQLDQSVSETSL